MVRRVSIVGPVLVAILVAGCGSATKEKETSGAGGSLSASTRLIDLEQPNRKAALFSLFNEDAGVPRVVLLVSPT